MEEKMEKEISSRLWSLMIITKKFKGRSGCRPVRTELDCVSTLLLNPVSTTRDHS